MNLKQLQYFVIAVEEGSMTAAARSLGAAQPALSQQISNLEKSLGTKVLDRLQMGVKPTEAGEKLLQHARIILAQAEEARREITETSQEISGEVKIALTPMIAKSVVPSLLKKLAKTYPAIRLKVHELGMIKCYQQLTEARVDFGIIASELVSDELNSSVAYSSNMYLMGAIDNSFGVKASTADICLAEALKLPIAILTRPHPIRMYIDREIAAWSLQADWYMEIDSSAIIRHYVNAGVAFALMPKPIQEGDSKVDDLFARKVVDPVLIREYSLCWPNMRPLSRASIVAKELTMNGLHHGRGGFRL